MKSLINKFDIHDKIYFLQFGNPIAGIVVQKGFDNHNNIWKYHVLLEDAIMVTNYHHQNHIHRTNTLWVMEEELVIREIASV